MKFSIFFSTIFCSFLYSDSGGDPINFPLFSIIPFIGILFSIALIPLINHHFWERHYGKVSLFWGLLFFIPTLLYYETSMAFEGLFPCEGIGIIFASPRSLATLFVGFAP